MPVGIQWISGLSRGVSTRAALRLFVVTLCVLITLLMAILNFVRSFNIRQVLVSSSVFLFLNHVCFSSQFFLPGHNCTSITNRTELEGLNLYTVPVS